MDRDASDGTNDPRLPEVPTRQEKGDLESNNHQDAKPYSYRVFRPLKMSSLRERPRQSATTIPDTPKTPVDCRKNASGGRQRVRQPQSSPQTMKRPRRVFGRVMTTCPATGKEVRIELTRQGLRVRVKRSRKVQTLSLPDLATLATGQGACATFPLW